jgi:hypothetical protein
MRIRNSDCNFGIGQSDAVTTLFLNSVIVIFVFNTSLLVYQWSPCSYLLILSSGMGQDPEQGEVRAGQEGEGGEGQ